MKMIKKITCLMMLLLAASLVSGCRPEIEFSSDVTSVAPGSTVTLTWEVDFARGSNANKVTISPGVGLVEAEGSYKLPLYKTTQFQLKVSSFVFGMPILTKETLQVQVFEENYRQWDFENSAQDWQKAYVFYHLSQEGNLLCTNSTDNAVMTPHFPGHLDSMASSYSLCMNNDQNSLQHPDTDLQHQSLAYAYRKISAADGFAIKAEQSYQVRFEVKYGIRFNKNACNDLDNDLSKNFQLVVAATQTAPEIQTHAGWRKFSLQALRDIGYETGVNSQELLQLTESQPWLLAKQDIYRLQPINKDDTDMTNPDYQKLCEQSNEVTGRYSDIAAVAGKQIIQTSNGSAELWLLVGVFSDFDKGQGIEVFFDSISALVAEQGP